MCDRVFFFIHAMNATQTHSTSKRSNKPSKSVMAVIMTKDCLSIFFFSMPFSISTKLDSY